MMAGEKRQWIVGQIGSREHYAVPRAMHRHGMLGRLYTDIWIDGRNRLLSRSAGRLGGLAGRNHAEIPADRVTAFNYGAILRQLRNSRRMTEPERYRRYIRVGSWFSNKMVMALERRPLTAARDAAFLFNTGALEAIEYFKRQGVPSVVDQIDVAKVEEAIIREEAARWPGWQDQNWAIPTEYFDRLYSEWALADAVVVNSNWTKRGLVQQGVATDKIHVVPLAYEADAIPPIQRAPLRGRKLRVLFLGQLILRKGLPYLFEAARLLLNEPVEFQVVGFPGVTADALSRAPANVRVGVNVPHGQTSALYAAADVFVLPTMSDGFAITQIEAMAHGLPVIATDRCGDVVQPGVNGVLVPAGDAAALADAIARLAADPDRVAAMSAAARERSRDFSMDRLAQAIAGLFPSPAIA